MNIRINALFDFSLFSLQSSNSNTQQPSTQATFSEELQSITETLNTSADATSLSVSNDSNWTFSQILPTGNGFEDALDALATVKIYTPPSPFTETSANAATPQNTLSEMELTAKNAYVGTQTIEAKSS